MKTKWFDMWLEDKQWIIEIMYKNISADLNVGYDPFGKSIREARKELNEYIDKTDEEIKMLALMDEKKAERWCYIDMKRRGAI